MTRVLQIKKGSFRHLDGCSSIYVRAQIAIEVPKKLAKWPTRGGQATNSAMNLSIRGVLSGKRFPRLTFLRYQLAALFPALD